MWTRLFYTGLMCIGLAVSGCSPIPTDSGVGEDGFGELSYSNSDWGFQVSRPNDQWGIQVQTFELDRDTNGLAKIDVRIASPISQFVGGFRPQMQLVPRALPEGITLDQLVQLYEEQDLIPQFDQYRVVRGDKQRIQLNDAEAIQWQFRYSQLENSNRRFPGTQFFTAVTIHHNVAYYMIGNGSQDTGYPLEEYQQIVTSLRFQQ